MILNITYSINQLCRHIKSMEAVDLKYSIFKFSIAIFYRTGNHNIFAIHTIKPILGVNYCEKYYALYIKY